MAEEEKTSDRSQNQTLILDNPRGTSTREDKQRGTRTQITPLIAVRNRVNLSNKDGWV